MWGAQPALDSAYKTVEKWYKDKDSKVFYSAYLMIGKLTIAFMYPLFRLIEFLKLNEIFSGYSKVFFLLIAIIFFTLDYFFIKKKFDIIVKTFDKKTVNEVAKLRLYDYVIKFLIISLNLILMFWIK